MPYCDECGEELKVGDKFCSNCGTRVYAKAIKPPKTLEARPIVPKAVRMPKTLEARPITPQRIDLKTGIGISQKIDVLRERAIAARHNMWISIVCLLIGFLLLGVGFYLYNITEVRLVGLLSYEVVRPYYLLALFVLFSGGGAVLAGVVGSAIHSSEHGRIMREIGEPGRRE